MQQEAKVRTDRRHLGLLAAEIARIDVENDLADPRTKKGNIANSLRQVLTATMVGIFAGCNGFADVERLTANLAPAVRRLLGLGKRLPDTSLGDVVVRLDFASLRDVLRKRVRAYLRGKRLLHDFPLRVASLDGKATTTFLHDAKGTAYPCAQIKSDTGRATVRTITACLISTPARPCIDMHPVPPQQNEMSVFESALDALLGAYGRKLFDVVMYDSGAASLANANLVVQRGLDYVLILDAFQPTLLAEATRLMGSKALDTAQAKSADSVSGKLVERHLWYTALMTGYLDWRTLKTVVRVCNVTTDKTTGERTVEDHYYLSSLRHTALLPAQWLEMIRRRWSVDCVSYWILGQNHNTLDTALRENKRPWLRRPQGMLVMNLLRRLVYNALAIFRSVTTRSESKRETAWKELLQRTYDALIRATQVTVAGLRRRETVCG